jgi:hypothetical protein
MHHAAQFQKIMSVVTATLCMVFFNSQSSAQDQAPVRRTPGVAAFMKAIDMAPVDAVSLAVVPDAKSLGEDMGELAAKLQRMQALTEMKPLDLLKSQLGIGPGMNDRGVFLAWFVVAADQSLQWCALIPTTDSAQFLQANFEATPATAPDAFVWRGKTVYAKSIEGWVVVSQNADLARSYVGKPGLAERLKNRLGERGFSVLCDGDIGLWAGPQSLADIRNAGQQAAKAMEGATATPNEKDISNSDTKADTKIQQQTSSSRDRVAKLMEGLTDGVTSIDVDPLGVLVRTYAVLDPASELGKSARGGAHAGANLNRLPRGPFVVAVSADMAGLGGTQAFLDLAAQIPGGEQVPAWVEQNKNLASAIQFAIYPSKLGVVGGGLLNEAMLWIATAESTKAKSILEQWMLSLSGEVDGQKRDATWEKDRVLKNGISTDAYAIKDIPLPKNGQPARKSNPMERIVRSLMYGPKGPNGFVKTFPDGVFVTFSQRPDVIEKAVNCATGTSSLESDAVLTALRGWMMPKPDALAFVGVGSLLNVVRQAANAFPMGGIQIPDAPPDLEPIALALSVDGSKIETSTMIPTNVIGVVVAAYADRKEAQQEEQQEMQQAEPQEKQDHQPDVAAPGNASPESPTPPASKTTPRNSASTTPASKNP